MTNAAFSKKLLLGVLWLLPFYLPLTVWVAGSGDSIYVFSAWKELCMAVLLLCLLRPLTNLLKTSDKTLRLLNGLIGIYVLLGFLYVFWADSLFEFTAGFLFDTRFLFFFLIAQAIVRLGLLKPKHVSRIVITSGIVLSCIAIVQVLILPATFLEHLGYEAPGVHLRGVPPSVTPLGEISDFIRPQASLRGPNPLGAFLVLPLALLVRQIFESRRRNLKALLQGLVIAIGLLLTFSRSAWVAALVSIFIIFFIAFGQRLKSLRKLPLLLVSLLILGVLIAGLQTKTGRLIILRQDKTTSINASDDIRSQLNREALRDVRDHPLGHGPGNAGPVSALDQNDRGRIAENYYLQVAQELGWLGLGLFLTITVVLLRRLWQLRSDSLAVVAFATLVGLSIACLTLHVWADEVVAIAWWSFAGAVIGAHTASHKKIVDRARKKS